MPAMVARSTRATTSCAAGARTGRTRSSSRRLPSILANRLISWATGVRLHDYGCSLKVFRAEVVKPLQLYGEMHRFLPALASEMGVAHRRAPVNHRARVHGRSKYGISRTVRVRARSADRQVPAELLDPAAADLRAARHGDGLLGRAHPGLSRLERSAADRRSRERHGRCSCSASCSSSPACSSSRSVCWPSSRPGRITSRRASRSMSSANGTGDGDGRLIAATMSGRAPRGALSMTRRLLSVLVPIVSWPRRRLWEPRPQVRRRARRPAAPSWTSGTSAARSAPGSWTASARSAPSRPGCGSGRTSTSWSRAGMPATSSRGGD